MRTPSLLDFELDPKFFGLNSAYQVALHEELFEIEIPKKTYKLTLPDFIKEVNLLEVTGLKQFSNRNLSLKITK